MRDEWLASSAHVTIGLMAVRYAVVVSVLVVSFSGCGSSPTDVLVGHRDPNALVRDFLKKAAAHDGPAACALLSGQGKLEMAAYPYPYGDIRSRSHHRSCEDTVSQLGTLPRAAEWPAVAKGTVQVAEPIGLDNRPVHVTYAYEGAPVEALGAVIPSFTGALSVSSPITPPRLARARIN